MLDKFKEWFRFCWLLVWLVPALPGLIEQGKYEEDLQSNKIG